MPPDGAKVGIGLAAKGLPIQAIKEGKGACSTLVQSRLQLAAQVVVVRRLFQ
jgi:hypothetical protein